MTEKTHLEAVVLGKVCFSWFAVLKACREAVPQAFPNQALRWRGLQSQAWTPTVRTKT